MPFRPQCSCTTGSPLGWGVNPSNPVSKKLRHGN